MLSVITIVTITKISKLYLLLPVLRWYLLASREPVPKQQLLLLIHWQFAGFCLLSQASEIVPFSPHLDSSFHRFDFLCMPIFHPRYKREFFQDPAKSRPGPQTRSDLLLSGRGENLRSFHVSPSLLKTDEQQWMYLFCKI